MHFSLRTLLIATTAVAIYVGGSLGMMRTLRGGGSLPPISFLFFADLPLFVLWVFATVWGYERRERPGMKALLGGLILTAVWRFASPLVQALVFTPSGPSWEGAYTAFTLFSALVKTTIWALLLYALFKTAERNPTPAPIRKERSTPDIVDR
jgi:hypothetical protein